MSAARTRTAPARITIATLYVHLGCWVGTGGNNGAYGCVRSSDDGTSYRTPSTSYVGWLYGSGEWVPCPSNWMSVSGSCTDAW